MLKNNVFGILLLLGIVASSCTDSTTVFSSYTPIPLGSWKKDKTVSFSFQINDTLHPHQLYIYIRNDKNYAYSNLFLLTTMIFPNGTVIKDTLEYEMTNPEGKFLGKGYAGVIENKLWYKENVVFTSSAAHTIDITHGMRKNGEVKGIDLLEGIMEVGFQVQQQQSE